MVTTDQPTLSLEMLKVALRRVVEVYSDLLNSIEETLEAAPDSDPIASLVDMMHEEGVGGWAQLYVDPTNQAKTPWLSILPPAKINAMAISLAAMSSDEQTAWVKRIYEEGEAAILSVAEMTPMELQTHWPDVSDSDIGSQWLRSRHCFVMAALFNNLTAMQTGKTMYQLVAEAIDGDEDSFVKAVQMDKTVLDVIPYFKERCHQAAERGEIAFLRRIHEHRNKPLTATRLQYAKLWLVFDTLDNMSVLAQFERDMNGFAELCQELRVYGPHPDVAAVDVEDFASRLKDYRRTRRQLAPRTESSVLVKDVSSPNPPP
jgi:hypothetical protein